jgi:hypothetical protein
MMGAKQRPAASPCDTRLRLFGALGRCAMQAGLICCLPYARQAAMVR